MEAYVVKTQAQLKARDLAVTHLFILIIILLKLPTFLEPMWHIDEGIYAGVATQMNHGDLLYRDVWDNKPPMIYYVYLAFFKIFGFDSNSLRLLGLTASVVSFSFFDLILKTLFSEKMFYLPQIAFIVLMNSTIFEGEVVNAEVIFVALTLPALFFFLTYLKTRMDKFLYLSFLMYGLAITVKIHPIFELLAVTLFLTVFLRFNLKVGYKTTFLKLAACFVIAALPYVLFLILFLIQGNFKDFLTSMFVNGVDYIHSSAQSEFILTVLTKSLLFKSILLLILAIFLLRRQIKNSREENVIFLITVFSVYAILLSGREFAHYLLQGIPLYILSLVFLVNKASSLRQKFPVCTSIAGLVISLAIPLLSLYLFFLQELTSPEAPPSNVNVDKFFDYHFNYYPNFIKVLSGKLTLLEYQKIFNPDIENFNELLQKTKNLSGKKVYLWDNYPVYYFLNDIEDSVKYVTYFHLDQEWANKNEFIRDLITNSDALIFKDDKFKALTSSQKETIEHAFAVDQKFGSYIVYKRIAT